MAPDTVTRRDHLRRMARFYAVRLQPTLFGAWSVVREWGRIGSPGTIRDEPHPTIKEAERAAAKIAERKRRKGYR
jgi:predicted DNA-binding WGR domain protein